MWEEEVNRDGYQGPRFKLVEDQDRCEHCDGEGEVYAATSVPGDDGWATCGVCGGSKKKPTNEEIAVMRGDAMCFHAAQDQIIDMEKRVHELRGWIMERIQHWFIHYAVVGQPNKYDRRFQSMVPNTLEDIERLGDMELVKFFEDFIHRCWKQYG